MTNKTGKLIVISGPAGVGKSTIVKEVLARTGAAYSVSATTRQPRAGEVDGRDYCFVNRERFTKMIADGQLLEWAEVFTNYYGTPAKPVLEAVAAGKKVILEIDVQGGMQVAKKMPSATFVMILPPDHDELVRRLSGRGSEDADSLARRLAKAQHEIQTARESGVYNRFVVNDDLQAAIGQVVDIVNEASE